MLTHALIGLHTRKSNGLATPCCVMQDGEVRRQFERSLKKQGFDFKLNTKVCLLSAYLT